MKPQRFPHAYIEPESKGKWRVVSDMVGGGTGNTAKTVHASGVPDHTIAVQFQNQVNRLRRVKLKGYDL